MLQLLVWVPTRLLLRIFCSFQVTGLQKASFPKGGVLFACNHSSELDPILVPAALSFFSHNMPMFYVSLARHMYRKNGLKKYIYGGILFKTWGAYEAYRGLKNYEKALKNHIKILQDNHSVCIFPGGRKNTSGKAERAKGGVAFLCHRTQKPIVPVHIQGSEGMTWARFLARKHNITVHFGEPLSWRDISNTSHEARLHDSMYDYKKSAQVVMSAINRN